MHVQNIHRGRNRDTRPDITVTILELELQTMESRTGATASAAAGATTKHSAVRNEVICTWRWRRSSLRKTSPSGSSYRLLSTFHAAGDGKSTSWSRPCCRRTSKRALPNRSMLRQCLRLSGSCRLGEVHTPWERLQRPWSSRSRSSLSSEFPRRGMNHRGHARSTC